MTTDTALPLLLTVEMVAEVFHCHPSTIWRKVANGTFPPPTKREGAGSRVLWHRDIVLAHAKKRQR